MGRQGVSAQRELFVPAMPVHSLPPEVRRRLLALLVGLLLEVTTTETVGSEAGDDQDHA